jgi:hypothetical protein
VVSICSFADVPPAPPPPSSFWEVIQEWGYNWLWEDLRIVGPSDWLATAIVYGTCMVYLAGGAPGGEWNEHV